jgi:type I restriction enzyme M protein
MAVVDFRRTPNPVSHGALRLLDLARSKGTGDYIKDVLVPVSALILLRWAEQREEEAEAIAAFENRPFQRILTGKPFWPRWQDLPPWELPRFLSERFRILRNTRDELSDRGVAANLHQLEEVFDRERVDTDLLRAALSWVAEQSLETIHDRERFAEAFEKLLDAVLASIQYGGEFFTPRELVELMVEVANPQPGQRVYDPCFGTGGLLAAAGRRIVRTGRTLSPNAWVNIQRQTLYGVEIRPPLLLIGLVRMILAGIDSPHLECGNSLERDIGRGRAAEGFDCILAHPPFGGRVPREYAHFPIRATATETAFLQHIMTFLKPEGRAVVLVPEGVLFRSGPDARVREELLSRFCVEGVLSLPAGAFLPYTGVKTSILVFRKTTPADSVWFQEVQRKEERQSKNSVAFSAMEKANLFCSRTKTPHAWLTPRQELEARGFELVVKRSGSEELEGFLQELQTHSPEIRIVPLEEIAEVFPGVGYDRDGTTTEASSPLIPPEVEQVKLFEEPILQQNLLQVPHVGLLRVGDIEKGEVKAPSLFLTADGLRRVTEKHRLQVGDVLVTATGTVGKVGLVREGLARAVPAKSLIVIRVKKDIQPRFLLRLLQSGPYQDWLAGHASGTVIRHLSANLLRPLRIPIPPAEIQQQIGTALPTDAGVDVLRKGFATEGTISRIESFLLSDASIQDLLAEHGPIVDKENISRFLKLAVALKRLVDDIEPSAEKKNALAQWLSEVCDMGFLLVEALLLKGAERLVVIEKLRSPLNDVESILPSVKQSIRERVEAIGTAMERALESACRELLEQVEISTRLEPPLIDGGRSSELTVYLKHEGALLLRFLSVKTEPDRSEASFHLFRPGEEISFPVSVSPRAAGTYPLLVKWDAIRLDGEAVSGEIASAFEVRSLRAVSKGEDLGTSPYVVMTPIDSAERPEMFKGREDIITRIHRSLRPEGPATVLLLEGNRRTGKTSILKRLLLPEVLPGWIPVYCSFQSAEGDKTLVGLPTGEIFYNIARELILAVHRANRPVEVLGLGLVEPTVSRLLLRRQLAEKLRPQFATENPFEQLDIQIESILDTVRPRGVLLMLDEFEKVQEGIDSGVTSSQLPENIRYLFHTYNSLSGILAGSPRLKRLRQEYWNPLFGIGKTINVSALDPKSARDLVTKPVEGRLVFAEVAKDAVLDLCACQPYLIQALCDRIFEECANSGERSVTERIVRSVAEKLIENNEHFQTLWLSLRTERQRYLTSLVDRLSGDSDRVTLNLLGEKLALEGVAYRNPSLLGDDLSELRELDVLSLEKQALGNVYRLKIPLFSLWLRKNVDANDHRMRARQEGLIEQEMR